MAKRRKLKYWAFQNAELAEAKREEYAAMMAKVPEARLWKLTGRRLPEFSADELNTLQARIAGYVASGRCRGWQVPEITANVE